MGLLIVIPAPFFGSHYVPRSVLGLHLSSLPTERIVSGGEDYDPFYRWSIQGHPIPLRSAVLAILELKGPQPMHRSLIEEGGEFPASWLRWEWEKAFSGPF